LATNTTRQIDPRLALRATQAHWQRPCPPTVPGLTSATRPVYEEGVRLPDRLPRPADAPQDWRTVAKPPAIAALPVNRRGYPVFANVLPPGGVPQDGKIDFRVLDMTAHIRAIKNRTCGICGGRLPRRFVFIGGPMCVQNRVFGDVAMHLECADYARQVCPFLVNRERQYDLRYPEGYRHDPNVILTKPERLVLYGTDDYLILGGGVGKPVLIVPPARWVEWFQPDGRYLCRTRPTRYAQ